MEPSGIDEKGVEPDPSTEVSAEVVSTPSSGEGAGETASDPRARGITSSGLPNRTADGSWPLCGARTRGERAGRTCKAAGCGFGGRCLLHGGACSGTRGVRLVLFSSQGEHVALPARWAWWAVPSNLWELLPLDVQSNPEASAVAVALARAVSAPNRRKAWRWPQELGFRVVKRLAERGRLAFVLVHETNPKALGWAMQEGVFDRDRSRFRRVDGRLERRHVHRIEPEAFTQALARSGHDWRRGPKSPPCGCQLCKTGELQNTKAAEIDGSAARSMDRRAISRLP